MQGSDYTNGHISKLVKEGSEDVREERNNQRQ